MSQETIFTVVIAILSFDFVFERVLEWLNTSRQKSELPKELAGIYDEEKYKKSIEYSKTKDKFGMLTSTFSFVVVLIMLFVGGFGWINNWAAGLTSYPILQAFLFFGVIGFANDIITLPFQIYGTFGIEQRFGFNTMTAKIFILDKVKGWLLSAIIGGGLLALIIWIYSLTQNWFWIIAWSVIVLFMLFMTMFYSNLIVPLFNKQKPLEEGGLRDKLNSFSEKVGFKLDNIFVMDGSKRSTKANAYFTGLGPKKRIVLFDTLVNDLNEDEIVAVLAHEVGHYKKKHTTVALVLSVIQTGIMFFLLSKVLMNPDMCGAFGSDLPTFHLSILAFGMLYSPLSFLLSIGMNVMSRKNEYEADDFANTYADGKSLGEALKKLSVKSLSNLLPHPAYVFFHYSHPTLLQRLKHLKL